MMFYIQNQSNKVHRFKWSYTILVLQIEPQLLCGQNVMIAAHGNSLRSIIMYLDKLTSQEVIFLLISDFPRGNTIGIFSISAYLFFTTRKQRSCPPSPPLLSWQVISLELSTGIPMLYIFKEGKFIRRGSPVAPTEAGVYAYTRVCNFCPICYFFICSPSVYLYFIYSLYFIYIYIYW